MKDCVICKKPYDGRTNRGIDYCRTCSGIEHDNRNKKTGGFNAGQRDVGIHQDADLDHRRGLPGPEETVQGTIHTNDGVQFPERDSHSTPRNDGHGGGTEGGTDDQGNEGDTVINVDDDTTSKVDPVLKCLQEELEFEEKRLAEAVESEKIAKARAKLLRIRMQSAKAETRRVRYDTLSDRMGHKLEEQLDVRDKVIKQFVHGEERDPKLSQGEEASQESDSSSDSVLESDSSTSSDETLLGATGGKKKKENPKKKKTVVPEVKK